MAPLARVRIVMWEGASLWIVDAAQAREGETGRADFHAHPAIQISLAIGGWFRLDTQDAHVRSEVAAVAADTRHVIDAEGLTGIVFIEPESEAGRAITRRFFAERELVAVETEAVGDFVSDWQLHARLRMIARWSRLAASWYRYEPPR